MSKKLILNNYSENGLIPVIDGLICWLDGRDGKNGDTVWKDRSGNGNDVEIIGCEWTGLSLKINDRGANEFLINKIINGNYTMEVYFKSNNSSSYSEQIKVITANDRKTYINASSVYIRYAQPQYLTGDAEGTIKLTENFIDNLPYYVATVREDNRRRKIFVNNNKPVININYVPNYIQYIGNWGSGKMMGEYFSIRLYNRALTEEEIKQNYLYEQSIERGE